jgi:ABC-type lipoprotein export system ATPase subunit
MNIKFENIVPYPLIDFLSTSGELWGKQLALDSKSIVHILAPSGSGKTTLVSLIYGLRNDFYGTLLLNESSTTEFNNDNWSEVRTKKISVVFQDLQLLEDLTAFENILLKNQLTNQFSVLEIEEMARKLGVFNKLNDKINTLSRGEKQRVAIIRSLCMPFNWILLDEPFSHLDEDNTAKSIDLIKSVVEMNGAGVIMVNLHADSHFDYELKIKMV